MKKGLVVAGVSLLGVATTLGGCGARTTSDGLAGDSTVPPGQGWVTGNGSGASAGSAQGGAAGKGGGAAGTSGTAGSAGSAGTGNGGGGGASGKGGSAGAAGAGGAPVACGDCVLGTGAKSCPQAYATCQASPQCNALNACLQKSGCLDKPGNVEACAKTQCPSFVGSYGTWAGFGQCAACSCPSCASTLPCGAGGASGSAGAGGSPSCQHDVCTTGAPLPATCGTCEKQVCNTASYCCKSTWDDTCVQQAQKLCGAPCGTTQTCDECQQEKFLQVCGDVYDKCLQTECGDLLDCFQSCNDDACYNACFDKFPGGQQGYYELADCVLCKACGPECKVEGQGFCM